LFIYFAFRYLCLGTLLGGYGGVLGESINQTIIKRWLDPEYVCRLFYPLSFAAFTDARTWTTLLTVCYLALIGFVALRSVIVGLSWRWWLFLATWIFSVTAPLYQVWGLGYNLEDSRYYLFLTMPLSMALSSLVFLPTGKSALLPQLRKIFPILSV